MFFVVQPIHSYTWPRCYRMLGLHTQSISTFSFPTEVLIDDTCRGPRKWGHDATSGTLPGCVNSWLRHYPISIDLESMQSKQSKHIYSVCRCVQKAWPSTMSRKRRAVLSNTTFVMAAVAGRCARLVSHSLQGLTVRCTSSDSWSWRSQKLNSVTQCQQKVSTLR